MLYPIPHLDKQAWNDTIDAAIHFLEEHKLIIDIKNDFKRGDEK